MSSIFLSLGLALASAINPTPQEATLLFAGDAMMHGPQIEAARRSDGSYSYDECFTEIAPIVKRADYAVVNLETPLAKGKYSGYPCFNAPDSYATALTNAGFDFFLTANNHSLDRRDNGVRRTIATLDSLGIPHVGTFINKAARYKALPMIIDVNGFKIAMLNYTYGTNGIKIQSDIVVDYIDKDKIKADIQRARQAGAELIMAAMHWGDEYVLLPNKSQVDMADFLVKEGVELVIGGHPHVIEPMEMRRGKGKRPALVVYSLGNLISNMSKTDCRGGALVEVKLKRDPNGVAYVDGAKYRLVFVEPGQSGGKNYRLYPAERYNGRLKSACDAFVRSADGIFNKHNIDVPRDTTHVIDKIVTIK